MAKYLVIVESPKKTGYIKKFLGKDYDVIASVGHIADLPKKKISVSIKDDFKPTYEINSDKKEVVKKIKEKAKKAEIVYLCLIMIERERQYHGTFQTTYEKPQQ